MKSLTKLKSLVWIRRPNEYLFLKNVSNQK